MRFRTHPPNSSSVKYVTSTAKTFHRYRALAAVPGAAPEQLVRLIHLVPLPQRRGAVAVVPMAGELATCADVREFSRPASPDDRLMTADTTSKRQLTAE